MFRSGEQWKFGLRLDFKYGEGVSEELQTLANTTYKKAKWEYEDDISYYKNFVNNIKKEKGIE